MPIQINNLQEIEKLAPSQTDLLEQVLQFGLSLHEKTTAEVSVILADNPYLQNLNLEYRGIDQPTDVLSFAMQEDVTGFTTSLPEDIPELLGDIYISIERGLEQAESYGHSFERELCYLAIHGLLHLLGYDHQNPEETTEMRAAEERILTEFELRRAPL